MTSAGPEQRPLWVTLVMLLALVMLAVGLTFVYVFVIEPKVQRAAAPETPFRPPGLSTPFITPPVVRPETRPAGEADLADDTEVIGVVVNGKARAYVVRAFSSPFHHVVNDVVNDRPISLAYCNQTDCMKVFQGDAPADRAGDAPADGLGAAEPLQLFLVGMYEGRLMLKAGPGSYYHDTCEPISGDTPAFPYREHASLRTTWRKWRDSHPETDVYLGVDPAAQRRPDKP